MKFVILCDSNNVEPFKTPRQLSKIGNEKIIERTIRLLKENGVEDIIITSHDKRFDKFGVERYEPKNNSYKGSEQKGCWIDAFTTELITEPITFLFGDVFYSKEAIKTIVESETDDVLFFCTDIKKGKDIRYIKKHDEPLGFKIENTEKFLKHQDIIRQLFYKGEIRRPISWELYRSLNDMPLNIHQLKNNYVGINDITCDVDNVEDIKLIEDMAKKTFCKIEIIELYDDTQLNRRTILNEQFVVGSERAKYLMGQNDKNKIVAKLVEIYSAEIKEDK